MKRFPATVLLAALFLLVAGCRTLEVLSEAGTSVAVATGAITEDQAASINRSTKAVGKVFEQITPEQEYYIGRAVAATILSSYKPYPDPAANRYLNRIGQTLAAASDKPETFGGYHFLIMDTDEVNAFAAPGGLVLVSRGLLRCCRTEDAVAAVLAHEIGHVQHMHGLQAIKKSRLTGALTTLAAESARNLGGEELAQLTDAFEGSISDITATMVNSGYARKFETEADTAAVEILRRTGYNPNGLRNMLEEMDRRMDPSEGGFAKTHPDPMARLGAVEDLLSNVGKVNPPDARQARFKAAVSTL